MLAARLAPCATGIQPQRPLENWRSRTSALGALPLTHAAGRLGRGPASPSEELRLLLPPLLLLRAWQPVGAKAASNSRSLASALFQSRPLISLTDGIRAGGGCCGQRKELQAMQWAKPPCGWLPGYVRSEPSGFE